MTWLTAKSIYTDFMTAEKVSECIEKCMGLTYVKIVRRYLPCNFGEDSRGLKDLKDQVLQLAFHRHVVRIRTAKSEDNGGLNRRLSRTYLLPTEVGSFD
jgi:hypothetical protein